MANRTSWRIPINLNISYYFGGRAFTGTITNISENGVFINTEDRCLPAGSRFEVIFPVKDDAMHFYVKLIRSVKLNGHCGLGVELLNPSRKYKDYVESLLYVM